MSSESNEETITTPDNQTSIDLNLETIETSQTAVFIDKPMSPRLWNSSTSIETENEVNNLTIKPIRDKMAIEVSRPRKQFKQKYKLNDRNAEVVGVTEFRAYKDLNFKLIKEKDGAIQVSPMSYDVSAQTTWYRSVNKSIQYEASSIVDTEENDEDNKSSLLAFLKSSTSTIERALQQNETIDIYLETFRLAGDDEVIESSQTENDLREIKNFADPNYSKSKALICIDWMPKTQGILAVSTVKNFTFDRRVITFGQNSVSHILIWDFRQLVKPIVLLQTNQEIYTFKFNKTMSNIVVGGCVTGQIVLWDISESMTAALRKSNRNSTNENDDDDNSNLPLLPKYISSVEHSHRKCVADLFWLPPNSQINYRGQLVGQEHLDSNSYQFITVAGDGFVLVWDIRFEKIFADELRHIGKSKHMPYEKSISKDGLIKPLWAPIFRAQLKRLEGVGELSICKVCSSSPLKAEVAENSSLSGDHRSHLLLTSEEGDIIFADLSSRKTEGNNNKDDDEEDVDSGREYIRWIQVDQARPTVALQLSPFFPDILLSVGDWNFHIWKVGDDKPLFRSPISTTYLTAASWSPTRPAVILIATGDGQLHAWDFTDSSFRPSLELKATHSKITSMEYLTSSINLRQQLLAVGDETGTLHVFELPRNLVRPIHKEETVMSMFLDRENQRNKFVKESFNHDQDSESNAIDSLLSNSFLIIDDIKGNQEQNDKSPNNTSNIIEKVKKQEEEFSLLESKFLSELHLNKEDLLSFSAKTPLPSPPPKH
mmetsp:Transcript_7006/g.6284  ORF Transcript_7006/g.6284 Transcript_7006/m.6284 type:complete len:769 (-) Transcript_7006:8-2314(-)